MMLEKYSEDVIERARKIKLLVMDVDGVLTDGSLLYSKSGDRIKVFNVHDGLGIFLLKKAGIKCVILTAKASGAVLRRARELKVDKVYYDFHYKINALGKIRDRFKVRDEEICFVGDELIDIPVLKRVGLAVSPRDAREEVKPFVHMLSEKDGGGGAVREVSDLILRARGLWDTVTAVYYK